MFFGDRSSGYIVVFHGSVLARYEVVNGGLDVAGMRGDGW